MGRHPTKTTIHIRIPGTACYSSGYRSSLRPSSLAFFGHFAFLWPFSPQKWHSIPASPPPPLRPPPPPEIEVNPFSLTSCPLRISAWFASAVLAFFRFLEVCVLSWARMTLWFPRGPILRATIPSSSSSLSVRILSSSSPSSSSSEREFESLLAVPACCYIEHQISVSILINYSPVIWQLNPTLSSLLYRPKVLLPIVSIS